MSFTDDKELQEYRNIMAPPKAEGFRDGFGWKTFMGALFLGFYALYWLLCIGFIGSCIWGLVWLVSS